MKWAQPFYMPPFDLNELEAAREWFPNVDRSRMMELYGQWGGSVRWVLKRGGLEDSIQNSQHLREAIASTSIELLHRALRGNASQQVLAKESSSRCFLQ